MGTIRFEDIDRLRVIFRATYIKPVILPAISHYGVAVILEAEYQIREIQPRATNDDRWPTLLYPIHIAERILKVKLERALLGVPAALRHYLREVA